MSLRDFSDRAMERISKAVRYTEGHGRTPLRRNMRHRVSSRKTPIIRYILNSGTFTAGSTTTVGMTSELLDTHGKATVSGDEMTVTEPFNYAYVVCQYSMKNNTGTPSEDVRAIINIQCRLAPLGSWVAFHSVVGVCWQAAMNGQVALSQFNGSVIPNADCDGFRVQVVNNGASDTIGGGSGSLHVVYF